MIARCEARSGLLAAFSGCSRENLVASFDRVARAILWRFSSSENRVLVMFHEHSRGVVRAGGGHRRDGCDDRCGDASVPRATERVRSHRWVAHGRRAVVRALVELAGGDGSGGCEREGASGARAGGSAGDRRGATGRRDLLLEGAGDDAGGERRQRGGAARHGARDDRVAAGENLSVDARGAGRTPRAAGRRGARWC